MLSDDEPAAGLMLMLVWSHADGGRNEVMNVKASQLEIRAGADGRWGLMSRAGYGE